MRLVVFTMHYPYGHGEEFFEDEVRVAEKQFEAITIVTLEKPPLRQTKYIPNNAEIVSVRKDYSSIGLLFCALKCIVSINVIKEMLHGIRERGRNSFFNVTKSLIFCESAIEYLVKNEGRWSFGSADTIFYSYWLDASAVYLARHRKRLKGICVSRAHGGDCFFDRGFHPYRSEQIEMLDYIFPISETGRRDILEHIDNRAKYEDKILTAYLGVSKKNDVLNPYKKNPIKRIVTCSSIIPLKRLDLLIEALALIDKIQICWTHFGTGIQKKSIEAFAHKQLSAKKNISFKFCGHKTKEEIFEFYERNSVDLFINCSDVEGIPVSAMEAMSYGIPVVARNVGAISELVNNESGLLLPKRCDAISLADAIKKLLSVDDVYYQYRKGAKDRIKMFTANDNYASFYKLLVALS